ncbi:hypothetical protein ACJX0J_035978 [Zea mays]
MKEDQSCRFTGLEHKTFPCFAILYFFIKFLNVFRRSIAPYAVAVKVTFLPLQRLTKLVKFVWIFGQRLFLFSAKNMYGCLFLGLIPLAQVKKNHFGELYQLTRTKTRNKKIGVGVEREK